VTGARVLAYFSQNPCIQQENSSNISFICIGLRFFQEALIINRFESKSEDDLERWYDLIAKYLEDKAFIKRPRCSYSLFIKEKFPHIWDRYETKMKKKDEHLELEQTTLNAGTT
jgi:hypothetical protein